MTQQRSVRRLLSHSVVYGIGDLLTKMAKYILVPIYIAVMTKSEIGQLAILQAMMMVCWALSNLGLGAVVRRFYLPQAGKAKVESTDHSTESSDDRDDWVAGLWWVRLLVALVPTSALCLVAATFSQQLFPLVPTALVVAACITGYLRASTDIVESWFMIREEPVRYRLLTFSQFSLTTTLILIAVFGLSLGLPGVIYSELIAAATWTLVTGFIVSRSRNPSIQRIPWSEIFRYAWPVIPHGVFMWLLVSGDRLILQHYETSAAIGVYEVAYVLGSVLMVVAQGLRAAWLPDYFRTAMQPDGMARYVRLTNLYLLAIFSGSAGIILFCPELIQLVGGQEYAEAVALCRILTIGIAWFACFIAFNQPLLLKGRTGVLALLSGLGVMLNFALNLLLVPTYGTTESAIATVAAYSSMAIGSQAYSRLQLGVRWPLRSVGGGFVVLVAVAFVSSQLGAISVGGVLVKVVVLIVTIVTVHQTTVGMSFLVDKGLQRN